jgi:hypothetical protein
MIDINKTDWANYKIRITCRGCAESMDIDDIVEFQGELKKRTDKEIKQIITSIDKFGFSFPFFIWQELDETGIPENNYCMDGHGRLLALNKMRELGAVIPKMPVVFIDAKDTEEAKQKLLRINSQYGLMTVDSVMEFMGDIEINLDELQLPECNFSFGKNDESTEEKYKDKYEIIVQCENEKEQEKIYNDLLKGGIKCRLSTL